MIHSTQDALDFTDTHRTDEGDQLTVYDVPEEPRYMAAEVKVRGQWTPAVLDARDHTIVSYSATKAGAQREADRLNP